MFADAICSNQEFAESFRREMKTIFPDKPLERIPVNHPLFTDRIRRRALDQRFSPSHAASGRKRPGEGRWFARESRIWRACDIGDRLAVIFSPYDLSCALESRKAIDCEGYIRTDAAQIGMNIILYALHQ